MICPTRAAVTTRFRLTVGRKSAHLENGAVAGGTEVQILLNNR
jgi:hypothetical protein